MTAKQVCPACGAGELKWRVPRHVEAVGEARVTDGTAFALVCDKCGEYELTFDQLAGYQRRAAAILLREGRVTGAVVRYARKALGLRQAELAELLGCAAETVSRWENDREMPRAEQLALVALIDAVETHGLELSALRATDLAKTAGTWEVEVQPPPDRRRVAG